LKRFESGQSHFTQIALLYFHIITHEMMQPP